MDPRVEELQKYKVPRDEEDNRYVKDFAIDDEEGYKAFFERFGFVVVRDVLTLDECNRSVSDLYDIIEDGCAFRRDDVRTWNNFPANSIPRYGSPSRPPIFNRQFVLNRQNPNAYRVFSTLMNEPDLVVNHDRGCFFRPAMVDMGDGKLTKMKDWSTNDNLHLDMNPWNWMGDGSFVRGSLERLKYTGIQSADFIAENNQPCHLDGLQLQGVLNLADNFEEDGGFICVPGFYHHFHEFYSADPAHSEDGSSYNFRKSDPVFRLYKRVPMRPGRSFSLFFLTNNQKH